jgi:hypothetical protein
VVVGLIVPDFVNDILSDRLVLDVRVADCDILSDRLVLGVTVDDGDGIGDGDAVRVIE